MDVKYVRIVKILYMNANRLERMLVPNGKMMFLPKRHLYFECLNWFLYRLTNLNFLLFCLVFTINDQSLSHVWSFYRSWTFSKKEKNWEIKQEVWKRKEVSTAALVVYNSYTRKIKGNILRFSQTNLVEATPVFRQEMDSKPANIDTLVMVTYARGQPEKVSKLGLKGHLTLMRFSRNL